MADVFLPASSIFYRNFTGSKMNQSQFIIAAAILSTISTQSIAKQSIPTITVSNTKVEQNLNDVLSSTTIISKEEIEETNAQTVTDLLKTKAGIDIASNGGKGQTTSVFVRGASNKQTLVLIDGVRVSSTVDGTFAWRNLSPTSIERIEIVRGAKSSIYGSDAIGGVIQIFTKQLQGYYLNIGGGSYQTKKISAGLGASNNRAGFSLNLNREKSNSFSATNAKAGINTFNHDNDSYNNKSINLKLWVNLTDNFKAIASFLKSKTETEFDDFHFGGGTFKDISETDSSTYSLKLEHDISNKWQQVFTFGQSKTDSIFSEFSTNTQTFASGSKRTEFNWQHNLNYQQYLLILGADYYRDKGNFKSAFSSFAADKISNKGLYANLSGHLNKFSYALGLRHDRHDNFGNHTTYQIELGHRLDDNWSLRASHGTGFKAPTITELFFPDDFLGRPVGNPDLEPEKSKTTEFGLNYHSQNSSASMTFFNTKIHNLIEFGTPFKNVSQAQIRGLEFQYNQFLNDWKFDIALTLQNTEDNSGKRLIRRPDKKLALGVSRYFTKGHVRLESLFVSERDDIDFSSFPAAPVTLAAYSVFNLSGQYKINRHLSLGVRVDNLFDRQYETIYGYNMPERSYYLNLEYTGSL